MNYNRVSMKKIIDFFTNDKEKKTVILEKANSFSSEKTNSFSSFEGNKESPFNRSMNEKYQNFQSFCGSPKNSNPTLIQVGLLINEISFRFIDLEKQVSLFDVGLKEGSIELQKKTEEMMISGKLGNLQIRDNHNSNPYEILGLEEGMSSLCEIKFIRNV